MKNHTIKGKRQKAKINKYHDTLINFKVLCEYCESSRCLINWPIDEWIIRPINLEDANVIKC